jgi:hypothetical protein
MGSFDPVAEVSELPDYSIIPAVRFCFDRLVTAGPRSL